MTFAARTLLASLLVVASTSLAQSSPAPAASPRPKPCSSPEYRQFDFWLGEWTVTTADGKRAGENRIVAIQNGCVLHERWSGAGGGTGTSFNMYFDADRQWHQTWVDGRGGRLDLAGGLVEGKMVLKGEMPSRTDASQRVRHEISWEKLEGGRVRQVWKTSTDGGATWSTGFDGVYAKKG